jgi:hypothetical protein
MIVDYFKKQCEVKNLYLEKNEAFLSKFDHFKNSKPGLSKLDL